MGFPVTIHGSEAANIDALLIAHDPALPTDEQTVARSRVPVERVKTIFRRRTVKPTLALNNIYTDVRAQVDSSPELSNAVAHWLDWYQVTIDFANPTAGMKREYLIAVQSAIMALAD